ncbi:MAG: aspartate aminotransferase family protein [Pseudomonadota bacterium]|nr:aspartate aminotransferase family protein [Pseudomonadota bacterium]
MNQSVMPSYGRTDIAFEKGEGPYLYAPDGRKFLDFGAGIAVTALGHSHPHLIQALTEQAGSLWHTSNLYHIPQQKKLADTLVQTSFADTVFFCNSGAEAVEASIKLMRKYHSANGNSERYRMVSFEGSFHGRTLATIAAGANDAHRAGFGPVVDGFDHVSFGNMDEVRAAVNDKTAGIMVEPVQGEGGIRPADEQFLKDLRRLCDDAGLLLMFDEVQTGVGRTGKLWAHQWSDIVPDVMSSAKALGGGFPIGACLATAEAAKGIVPGTHGSTFGGNPLAAACANAVLDVVLGGGFLDHVLEMGRLVEAGLNRVVSRHPDVIQSVRGIGMMWGMKCVVPNGELVAKAFDHGLLTVPAGDNVVRFLPPLIVEENHIEEALTVIENCAQEFVS